MNEYFQPGSNPATSSPGSSAVIRAQFANIAAGFDKLPIMAGNAGEIVTINATGTALIASGFVFADTATLDGIQTLTNKTLSWADNTWVGFGTGATKDAGTLAGEVLLLAENNKLPAMDAGNLTNIPGLAAKADANNAVLTGAPTTSTPIPGDNSSRIANTLFVNQAVVAAGWAVPSVSSPLMNGVANAGVGVQVSRDDHVHPSDTSRAPTAGPSFTGTLTHSGDVVLSGSGKRITGDFSNDTVSNRLMFQSSTVNGNTVVGAIPNGTGIASGFRVYNVVDADNAGFGQLSANTVAVNLTSAKSGTGVYIPLNLVANGVETLRLDLYGNSLHLNPAGGLGYGAGAGSTASQPGQNAGNQAKSLNVTMTTPVGQFTMGDGSLASDSKVRFTLVNARIGANDNPRFWIVYPGSTSYRVWVDGVIAGACGVILENYSAAARGESVVIGFDLGKGSIA